MRVPIPVVIPLCLGLVGGVWWGGTRNHDFLKPPSEHRLAMIREKAGGSLPPVNHPDDVGETPESPAPAKPEVVQPQPRPADNRPDLPERTAAAPVTIHAETGKTTAAIVAPVLDEVARDLEQASSGMLKVTSRVSMARDHVGAGTPAPIAVWLSGPRAESHSTEVFVFTMAPPETLRDDVLNAVFKIVRSYLSQTESLTIPSAIAVDAPPMELLQTHVPRRGWRELGAKLNKTLE